MPICYLIIFIGDIEICAKRIVGFDAWKVFMHSDPVLSIFEPEQLVYLTPDSENTMEEIDMNKGIKNII